MIDCPNCGKQLMPDSSNPMRMKCTYCNYVLDPTAGMDPLPGLFQEEATVFSSSFPSLGSNVEGNMPEPPQGQPVIASGSNQSAASSSQPPAPSTQPVVPSAQFAEPSMQSSASTPQPNGFSVSSSAPGTQSYTQPAQWGTPVATSAPMAGMSQPALPEKLPKGFAIAALVLGILALMNCWIPFVGIISIVLGALALVFGILSLAQNAKGKAAGKGMSIAGVVCGGIALITAIIVTIITCVALWSYMESPSYYTYSHDGDHHGSYYDDDRDLVLPPSVKDGMSAQSDGMGFSDDAAWTDMAFTVDGKSYLLLNTTLDEFVRQSSWRIDYDSDDYPFGYIVQSGEEAIDIPLVISSTSDVTVYFDVYNPSNSQRDLEKCVISGVYIDDPDMTVNFKVTGGIGIGDTLESVKKSCGTPFVEDEEDGSSQMMFCTSDFEKSLMLSSYDGTRIDSLYLTYIL